MEFTTHHRFGKIARKIREEYRDASRDETRDVLMNVADTVADAYAGEARERGEWARARFLGDCGFPGELDALRAADQSNPEGMS